MIYTPPPPYHTMIPVLINHPNNKALFEQNNNHIWPMFWTDLQNIWQPITPNTNPTMMNMPLVPHQQEGGTNINDNSNGVMMQSPPPKDVIDRYICQYMHDMWMVEVHDPEMYATAFTHKSCENINGKNNERFEFLGDAVLSIIVTEMLFNQYPTRSEGVLTKLRMKMINGATLSEIGQKMQINRVVRVAPRLKQINKKLVEDAFEAIVCVIYKEHGLEYTRQVLTQVYNKYIDFTALITDSNYKEQLLKHSQKLLDQNGQKKILDYELLDSIGPAHKRHFRVQATLLSPSTRHKQLLGVGMGSTLRNAQQSSARESLVILGIKTNAEID